MLRVLGLILLAAAALSAQSRPGRGWKFGVSGDSRDCGDIVMPAIAAGVQKSGASFYWHLGDFRAIYRVDEDMSPPPQLGLHNPPIETLDYLKDAWPDFIEHQIVPFGKLPVYLMMGNHETFRPMSRDAWLVQFADWLETPIIRGQRLADDPKDHKLHAYYHWIRDNVDFISMDNSTPDQFDADQMKWLNGVLDRDEKSAKIQTIVAGMHEALPGSISTQHSMNQSTMGTETGRQVYEALWHAQEAAHKRIYVLASHSHFYMDHIFETPAWKGKVLPGWIVGTAGAPRYKLPSGATPAQHAQTDVYGYLIGTVAPDGEVSFDFHRLSLDEIRAVSGKSYPEQLIRWCYEYNKQ